MNIAKKLFIFLLISVFSFTIGHVTTKSNYTISGFGEGAIMLDAKTGDAWILEPQKISSSVETYNNPLDCQKDFCSAKGIRYFWVPTVVQACYADALSFGRNPKEAQEADEHALQVWKGKF